MNIQHLLKTKWKLKKKQWDVHWKIVAIYYSHYPPYDRCPLVHLEKYQGGRNSPKYVTYKQLKERWIQVDLLDTKHEHNTAPTNP